MNGFLVECQEVGGSHFYHCHLGWFGSEEECRAWVERVSPYTTATYRIVEVEIDELPSRFPRQLSYQVVRVAGASGSAGR